MSSLAGATAPIDNLTHFRFPEFNNALLGGCKSEIKALWLASKTPFDWDALDGAGEYNRALTNKHQYVPRDDDPERLDAPPNPGLREILPRDWKSDPAEKGRRLWLWWRIRAYECKEFRNFSVVVRLVALIQPSSAAMGRVFSQPILICTQCGVCVLESTLESRCMERCNKLDFPLELQQKLMHMMLIEHVALSQ